MAHQVIDFAMGDKVSGEMWVIAVLPEYIGQGIGSQLLGRVEKWLCESGRARMWLTTDIDMNLKAYSCYRRHAWVDSHVEDGVRYMVKDL